jgi:hypothetical protein
MMRGRARTFATGVGVIAAVLMGCVLVQARAAQQGGAPSIGGASFYSQEQASRGGAVFQSRCSGCHNTDLTGEKRGSARGGPPLTGPQFMANWEGENLDGLLARMRSLMPRDDPGGLADEVYLDLLAFISKVNGFPGGTEPLRAEVVADLQIPQKNGASATIGNFKLVQVVGCLAQADNAWTLTHTTEPVVTRDQPVTTGELRDAAAKPLGADVYRLISIASFKPEPNRGHRVLAKGLIYRASPNVSRLNVTDLQPLGSTCSN